MIEILRFIFADVAHFLGSMAILLVIAWAISSFNLIKINISNYHLVPKNLIDTEVDDDEEL